ncbi:MAG: VWA domain-containing protein [Planctomycetota bacterium]
MLAFTFLDPVAGIIAGSIAAPLLVLLYFLKLRRRPMRISSTMLWVSAAQDLQVNAPFRMIRPSWLLLLQLLILALLVGAIARPALDDGDALSGRVVLIIDRSASMNARDVIDGDITHSRLDEAKERADELLRRVPSSAEVMLIAIAQRAQVISNFTGDVQRVRTLVRELEPTDQAGDLDEAVRVLGAFIGSADATGDEGARVVVLSDGDLERTPGVTAPGLGSTNVLFERVGRAPGARAENVGIASAAARRDFQDPAVLRVFAQLVSTYERPIEVPVTLSLDGVARDAAVIEVPGAQRTTRPDGAAEYVAGEAAYTFSFEHSDGGVLLIESGRADALASDNVAGVLLRPPGNPRITLVRPDNADGVVDDLLEAVLRTLEPEDLEIIEASAYRRAEAAQEPLPGDLVIFDRVEPSVLPTVPTISIGACVPIPGVSREDVPVTATSARNAFAFWLRAHPVMRYVSLGNVAVTPRGTAWTYPAPDNSEGVRTTTLASGRTGDLITLLEWRGVGRLHIAFELEDSNWWRDASFPVFWRNAVEALTLRGEETAGVAPSTNEPVRLRLAPGAEEIVATGPTEVRLRVGASFGARSFGPLARAGLYEVRGVIDEAAPPDGPLRLPVSVLSRDESLLRTADSIDLAGGASASGAGGASIPREIWHWFVLGAAGLLCMEWLLYARKMKV